MHVLEPLRGSALDGGIGERVYSRCLQMRCRATHEVIIRCMPNSNRPRINTPLDDDERWAPDAGAVASKGCHAALPLLVTEKGHLVVSRYKWALERSDCLRSRTKFSGSFGGDEEVGAMYHEPLNPVGTGIAKYGCGSHLIYEAPDGSPLNWLNLTHTRRQKIILRLSWVTKLCPREAQDRFFVHALIGWMDMCRELRHLTEKHLR